MPFQMRGRQCLAQNLCGGLVFVANAKLVEPALEDCWTILGKSQSFLLMTNAPYCGILNKAIRLLVVSERGTAVTNHIILAGGLIMSSSISGSMQTNP